MGGRRGRGIWGNLGTWGSKRGCVTWGAGWDRGTWQAGGDVRGHRDTRGHIK